MNLTGDVETRSLSGTINAVRGISGMISTGAGRRKADHDVITASWVPDVTDITPNVIVPSEMSTGMSGAPPLTFTAAAGNLTDYVIYGAEGGVGDYINPDLFSGKTLEQGALDNTTGEAYEWNERIRSAEAIDVTAGTYHIVGIKSASAASYDLIARGFKYDSQGGFLGATGWIVLPGDIPIDVNCKLKIMIAYYYVRTIAPSEIQSLTIQKADNGVAIPVTVSGTTVTLLTSTPLFDGQKLTKADTNVNIPTVQGSNTLTVGTTVQPSRVEISYRVV